MTSFNETRYKNTEFFNSKSFLDEYGLGTTLEEKFIIIQECYYNDDTGFGTYLVESIKKSNDTEQTFKINGVFATSLIEGQTYKGKGFVTSFRGEKQLKVENIINVRPINKKGIILYLQSLKGLKSKAEIIYDVFGDNCINELINNPYEVARQIPGVGKKSVEKWKTQLEALSESQEIISTLLGYGISVKDSKKLFDEYKERIISLIENNPYFLIKKVKGYGFDKCDKIAREVGIHPSSEFRIQEGIIYILKQIGLEGHCYIPLTDLKTRCLNLLNIKLTEIEMERYKKLHSGKTTFKYYINENLPIDVCYKTMVSNLDKLKREKSPIKKELYKHVVYQIKEEDLDNSIESLILEDRIVNDNNDIFLKSVYDNEVSVADNLFRLSHRKIEYDREMVSNMLDARLKDSNVSLEEKQREACIEFNLSKDGFFVLNGSAGTGKTFTLLQILETHKELSFKLNNRYIPQISIFAPTGRASKVASVATKMNCFTIHKGLGYNPIEGNFEYNADNPLDSDVIVCDESSMLDLTLCKSFLEAIKDGAKVIFMGDIKQLPSVGAGNILKDIIESNTIPVITLNVIKRQGKLSGIVENANLIIEDKMVKTSSTKDAFVLPRNDADGVKKAIINSIHRILTFEGYSFEDIQVLAPQRKGSLGIYLLNYIIQKEFNPNNEEIKFLSKKFSVKLSENENPRDLELYFKKGDKVINIQNNYSKEHYIKVSDDNFIKIEKFGVTNGETGVIEYLKETRDSNGKVDKKEIMVKFDDYYILYENDFSEIEHSFAMTIHKSQGSAWKSVIIPVATQYWNMLDNNLFYTAVTRARDFLVMIGSQRAFEYAIKTHNARNRYTKLKERLETKSK